MQNIAFQNTYISPNMSAARKHWTYPLRKSKNLIGQKYLIQLKLPPLHMDNHVILMMWSCACESLNGHSLLIFIPIK